MKLRMAGTRVFPIRASDRMPGGAISWDLIAPHERRAERNHGKLLDQLAAEGGLTWQEALAVLQQRRYPDRIGGMAQAEVRRLAAGGAPPVVVVQLPPLHSPVPRELQPTGRQRAAAAALILAGAGGAAWGLVAAALHLLKGAGHG